MMLGEAVWMVIIIVYGLFPANRDPSSIQTELMARLLIDDDLGNARVFDLSAGEIIVGRAADSGLVLNDNRASRRHAAITQQAGISVIRDLNSVNGLYVNGERVSEKV